MRLCVFDLDHTLIRSPLDLAAMALDMRRHLERHRGPLPAKPDRYRVGELLHWSKAHAPEHETPLWEIALDHERRAVVDAALEPGAREAVRGRARGRLRHRGVDQQRARGDGAGARALRDGPRRSTWWSRATRCARSSPIPTAGA